LVREFRKHVDPRSFLYHLSRRVMAGGEPVHMLLQASPVVGSPFLGTAARRVDAVERIPSRRLFLDDSCKDLGANSPQLQPSRQQSGCLRQQKREPTTPRSPSLSCNSNNCLAEQKSKQCVQADLCRKLFSEAGSEVEHKPNSQAKQTWRPQIANFHHAPFIPEEAEECEDTISKDHGGGGSKSQEDSGDLLSAWLFRHSGEDGSARIHETTKLQVAIKELRERVSVSVLDAVEAAEARLAAQFLTAIVPTYDDLRKRVGALESRILDVPDPLSGSARDGRESDGQSYEHLSLVWPGKFSERIAALEEHSGRISALEQAVEELNVHLVSPEPKREVELQVTACLEPMFETLRNRMAALELQCATAICGRPVSDMQEAINASERRLLDELQAMRAENTGRDQVLSSQLLEVRVAALQTQVLQDDSSFPLSKVDDSNTQSAETVSY